MKNNTDIFVTECLSVIHDITDKGIVLKNTIAFPENNIHKGDKGILIINQEKIPFINTQTNNDLICHIVDPKYHNASKIGLKTIIQIDQKVRKQQIINLSRVYLFILAMNYLNLELKKNKICVKNNEIWIKHNKKKLTIDNINKISIFINNLIDKNRPVNCFGQYLPYTSYIGNVVIDINYEGIIAKFKNSNSFPYHLFYDTNAPFIL